MIGGITSMSRALAGMPLAEVSQKGRQRRTIRGRHVAEIEHDALRAERPQHHGEAASGVLAGCRTAEHARDAPAGIPQDGEQGGTACGQAARKRVCVVIADGAVRPQREPGRRDGGERREVRRERATRRRGRPRVGERDHLQLAVAGQRRRRTCGLAVRGQGDGGPGADHGEHAAERDEPTHAAARSCRRPRSRARCDRTAPAA